MQELAKEVLRVSRDENNCNEVAIIYDLDSPELAVGLSQISLEDAFYLLIHEAIKMIVAVTNRGSISYLVKTEGYDQLESRKLLREAIRRDKDAQNLKQKLDAEIEKEEENNRLSRQVEDHIRPLVIEIARKSGMAAVE